MHGDWFVVHESSGPNNLTINQKLHAPMVFVKNEKLHSYMIILRAAHYFLKSLAFLCRVGN